MEFKLWEFSCDWVKKALLWRGFAFPSARHTGVTKLGHIDLFSLFGVFKIRISLPWENLSLRLMWQQAYIYKFLEEIIIIILKFYYYYYY